MRIAVIGRGDMLMDAALRLRGEGHQVVLVVTAKEAPEYRVGRAEFAALAADSAAVFRDTGDVEQVIDAIEATAPDIGISVNYPAIVPQPVIGRFPFGILNAHGGDLPRYRGNACQAWAILNGESRIGLCVHRMTGELDGGDIVARRYLAIDADTKIASVLDWMQREVPTLFSDALTLLAHDPAYVLERQSPDPADALRCYPRRPEDGRINWSDPALQILRLVNASSRPYSGAFCELEGEKVVIWNAALAPPENYLAVPGQITGIGDRHVDVATGSGKLRVFDVETARGGTVAAPSIVRSTRQRFT